MKARFLKLAGSIALAGSLLASSAFSTMAQEKPSIKIGALFPMSGIAQQYGEGYKIAAELAIKDVNENGGINGSPLEFEILDDQLNAQQSVLLFRELVNKDVVAVLGPISGTSWQNVAPLANSMELLAINVAGVKAGVSIPPWAIRTSAADDTMIPEGIAEFVQAFPDAKRIVIAGDAREASGAAGMQVYKEAAEAHGLEVLDMIEFETTTKDFSPVAIKMRGLEPDAVFVSALGPLVLAMLTELQTQNFDKPIVVSPLAWAGPLVNTMGSAGKNVYSIGFFTNESTGDAARDAFIDRFLTASREVAHIPQPANISSSVVTYDTILMLASLMQEQGIDGDMPVSDIRQGLTEAVSKLDEFKGVLTYKMRDTGDAHLEVHLLKSEGDQWVRVLPADQRTTE